MRRFLPTALAMAALFGATAQADVDALPLEDIKTFSQVFEQVRQTYVDPVDDKTLFDNAMKGMVSKLDPHSAYLDAEAYRDLKEATSGEFAGIGIQVGEKRGAIVVIAPIDETPAARQGVQPGDRILAIGNTSTEGMTLQEAITRMRGDEGTELTLTLESASGPHAEAPPRTLTFTREIIQEESVSERTLAPGYGYIRISRFQKRTADEFDHALERLKNDEEPLQGLVLDLRNNPGGLLDSAVTTADEFLEGGLIVYTKGRLPEHRSRFTADAAHAVPERTPVVVLVNAGTASAAEIVAGALKDHQRAIIMGEPTFGKGSVQTVMPLSNGSALKLTTARYFTPDGHSIQATGIVPDIGVQRGTLNVNDSERLQVRERSLENHLINASSNRTETAPASELAQKDYPLGEALNLLRGLNVWGARAKGHSSD
ncbi:S41 family peptidase [Larsenimonas salina]|uniref:S41 family peptidase n=1 Tax=Larsenimonas salina TaxID=1295565 RepID=UPI002073319A|nr:S41 family peptidase [Larsenimonas salina]MCM5704634.1 S41 family peptidase [Larsenimonas salina]